MTQPTAVPRKRDLKLRAGAKRRKPEFARPESWRYVRLKENWRNPRGLDNKVRMSIKGWPPPVSSGYGGPRASRGLHPSGYDEVMVYNVEQVSKVKPNNQALRIAHTVGKRKRIGILAEARRRKIVVLNLGQAKEAAGKKVKEERKEEEETEAKEEQAQPKEAEEAGVSEKAQPEKKTRKRGGRTKQQ